MFNLPSLNSHGCCLWSSSTDKSFSYLSSFSVIQTPSFIHYYPLTFFKKKNLLYLFIEEGLPQPICGGHRIAFRSHSLLSFNCVGPGDQMKPSVLACTCTHWIISQASSFLLPFPITSALLFLLCVWFSGCILYHVMLSLMGVAI